MNINQVVIIISVAFLLSCGKSGDHKYQGYVEAENLFLASPYSGVLIKKAVKRGQWVKRGDLLFKLDENPEAMVIAETEAELLQAKKTYQDLLNPRRVPEIDAIRAQIEQTKSQLRLAELRVKRTNELYTKNAIDKESVDTAKARYEELQHVEHQYQSNLKLALQGGRLEQINAQRAKINALLAKVNQAKWQLEQKNLYAPADGMIFDTYFLQGEFVPQQHPIASLLEPEHIHIEFFVPAEALNTLHVGQSITFTSDGSGTQNKATLSYISPDAEYIPPLVYSDQNIDKLVFRIKANIHDPRRFKPGQPVVITGFQHGA